MGERNEIAVERDGIVLGWKLVVALAAATIGIYLTTVIAPLEAALEQNRKDITLIRADQAVNKKALEDVRLHIEASKHEHMSFAKDIDQLQNRVLHQKTTGKQDLQ